MAITASINGNMTITDASTGTVALVKLFSGLAMTGTAFTEIQSVQVGTTPVLIGLPISPVSFLYIKDIHPSQSLTVTWTANGGASDMILNLQPGSAIIFCETFSNAGITALTLTGSSTGTTVEYIMAG